MPTLSRSLWGLVAACAFSSSAMSTEHPTNPVATKVARSYGYTEWSQVQEIAFTFKVEKGDLNIARSWTWQPKSGYVKFESEGAETIEFNHLTVNDTTAEDLLQIDHRFVNDSFWLLCPFQIMWSTVAITDAGLVDLPIREGQGKKIVVQYPEEGGYTPGDAYDLYVDENNRIVEWMFRKGGGEEGSAITWEENVSLGPISVSTEHENSDGSLRLSFTGLKVTTTDGRTFTHK